MGHNGIFVSIQVSRNPVRLMEYRKGTYFETNISDKIPGMFRERIAAEMLSIIRQD